MPFDNLDDLFRQQLGQHATPPGEDLQRRLAELAEAERLDSLFRTGLGSHTSPPRRELWERLEDEHLHPQPRRRRGVVAWWQLSAAAMLLLALLAGGLWHGGYLGQQPSLATATPAASHSAAAPGTVAGAGQPTYSNTQQVSVNKNINEDIAIAPKKKEKKVIAQATATSLSPSSLPIATPTRPRRPATPHLVASSAHSKTQQPDAAAGALAATGGRNTPASQPPLPTPTARPEEPASRQLPALIAMMTPPEIVEVDVRRGPATARPAAAVVAAIAPSPVADQPRRRLRLGGLLRQADRLMHGESVSLADATGLPESVTLQARLGGRTVSKTIQL